MTRELHPWELPLTETLAREFHDVAALGTTFSPRSWASFIQASSQQGTLGCFGMFIDQQLVGVLVGILIQQCMTDVVLGQEIMWYVRPEHRQTLDSMRLLGLFEAWAKKRGAHGMIMARFGSTGDDDKLGKFYRRRGFREIETHYLKHPWQSQPQQPSPESEPQHPSQEG